MATVATCVLVLSDTSSFNANLRILQLYSFASVVIVCGVSQTFRYTNVASTCPAESSRTYRRPDQRVPPVLRRTNIEPGASSRPTKGHDDNHILDQGLTRQMSGSARRPTVTSRALERPPGVELNDHELALVLAALFELRITRIEDTVRREAIDALAQKLGGDRSAMFFGADAHQPKAKGTGARSGRSGSRYSGSSGDRRSDAGGPRGARWRVPRRGMEA